MQLCHQTIVRSCGVRGCELIRPLMSKRSEGENLRLIEFSLFESRDVLRMIANLYAHLGLGVKDLQELLERISANYFTSWYCASRDGFEAILHKIDQ